DERFRRHPAEIRAIVVGHPLFRRGPLQRAGKLSATELSDRRHIDAEGAPIGDSRAGIVRETMAVKRRSVAVTDESRELFTPKIYYFHPLLAGPCASWSRHLRRARDMGFDHLLTAPLF